MAREDWIVAALIGIGIAFVGIVAWAVSRPKESKPSSEGIRLRRVAKPKIVLRNVERVKVIRDRDGGLQELEIHREVRRE